MDNVPDEPGVKLSTLTVETDGNFGATTWNVCAMLYNIMPRDTRDELLRRTENRVVNPFFENAANQLLKQAGCGIQAKDLQDPSWSFQTIDVECEFGKVTWLIGQSLWDSIPEDQRTDLFEFVKGLIHEFFHEKVFLPLALYAQNKLRG